MPTISSTCLGVPMAVLSEGLRLWCVLAGLAACYPMQDLSAQAGDHDRDVVRVVLVDSTTGRTLSRTALRGVRHVWWSAESENAWGVLAWDTATAPRARVECATRDKQSTWRKLTDLDARRLPMPSANAVIRLSVNGSSCDRREFSETDGTWTGHYVAGFETSSFSICGDSAHRSIWVEWTAGAWEQFPAPSGLGGFLLRVRGRLVGPGAYGHLGAADYELTIDSVLFARRLAEGGADCDAIDP